MSDAIFESEREYTDILAESIRLRGVPWIEHKLGEEASELSTAVQQMYTKFEPIDKTCGEIADVLIHIDAFLMIHPEAQAIVNTAIGNKLCAIRAASEKLKG